MDAALDDQCLDVVDAPRMGLKPGPQKKLKKRLDKSKPFTILPLRVGTMVAVRLDFSPPGRRSHDGSGLMMATRKHLSVATSFAHARDSVPRLLLPRSILDQELAIVRRCTDLIEQLHGISRTFALALFITGARPRELLNLRVRDVDSRGMVFIRGLKRGSSRIVHCPLLLTLIPASVGSSDQSLFRQYSYAKFYRAVKALSRCRPHDPGVHKALGRLFRSAYASANLCLAAGDLQVVMRSLGHKTQTSTNFYISKGGELNGQGS